ncbi:MAG: hypothetical protein ACRESK_09920 [Gammaproteobacteria bacterium]
MRYIPVAHPAGMLRMTNFAPGKIVDSALGHHNFSIKLKVEIKQ